MNLFRVTAAFVLAAALTVPASADVYPEAVGVYVGTISGTYTNNTSGSIKRKENMTLIIGSDGNFQVSSDMLTISGKINASSLGGAAYVIEPNTSSNLTIDFKNGKATGSSLTVIVPMGDTGAVYQTATFKLKKSVL